MTVRKWMKTDNLSQKWLGRKLQISQQAVSWCLKHGFKARHFARLVGLSKGKVTLEDLANSPARRAARRAA